MKYPVLGMAVLAASVAAANLAAGADWPCFRGPDGNGVSQAKDLPTTWSDSQNIVWKTAMPGPGASSPIVSGDKIFLTCYSGYGLNQDEPGQIKNLEHHLLCVQASDGKILWDKAEKAAQPEREYRGFIALHGYASGTPVTDGQAVYAFFGRSGVFAYDFSGKQLWHADVGEGIHEWGSGTSPILYKNLVIVNASVESKSLVALDKASGKEVWRVGDIRQSWSTPVLVSLPGDKQELVVSLFGKAISLDPVSGKQLWECATLQDYVCPALIAHDGIVYLTAGRKGLTVAIRAGGRGDVTKSNVLWELKKTPKVATPLYHDGLLYWVDNRGAALCVKADSGQAVYEERLEVTGGGDKVYASVVLADGKVYAVSRQAGTFVLAAGPEFKQLAHNELGDKTIFNATPAVFDSRLLLRSDSFLYCIGK